MSQPANTLTLQQGLAALQSGSLSSVAWTTSVLDAIQAHDYGAFLHVDPSDALEQAKRADAARTRGEIQALTGAPIAVKDVLLTKGIKTTAASKMLENFVAPYDATVVEKLRAAGAVLVGKTNCDEFAMGSSNENSAFFPVDNPAIPGRIPGGSSGGSAAAVAGHQCAAAIGTDTGGSIRQPAALTGTVGLKPTYGRVSRFGLIAFASSLDQIGPMTKSVGDAALLLETIAGHDPRDSTSSTQPLQAYTTAAARGPEALRGMRIGVPRETLQPEGIQPAVLQHVQRSLDLAQAAGAELVDIELPHTEYAIATYYIIATAEASSNLARFDGVRYTARSTHAKHLDDLYSMSRGEHFGPEVKRRIMLGTYALSAGYYDAYYLQAQKARTLIRDDFQRAFSSVDAIAMPTTPSVAFEPGTKTQSPLEMYLSDIFTISCNLAGIPGLSIPCGTDQDGAPIGLQLLAPWFREDTLCSLGGALETLLSEHA